MVSGGCLAHIAIEIDIKLFKIVYALNCLHKVYTDRGARAVKVLLNEIRIRQSFAGSISDKGLCFVHRDQYVFSL